jgi:hypothetical protein
MADQQIRTMAVDKARELKQKFGFISIKRLLDFLGHDTIAQVPSNEIAALYAAMVAYENEREAK